MPRLRVSGASLGLLLAVLLVALGPEAVRRSRAAGGGSGARLDPGSGNALPLGRPGHAVQVHSDPSRGGPTGAPDPAGDLWWKGIPPSALVRDDGRAWLTGLSGLFVGTTDWSQPPPVYDLGIGRARPSHGPDAEGTWIPEVLYRGLGELDLLISLGSSGLPNPCLLPDPPAGCVVDPGSGETCAPPVTGYEITIEFAQPLPVPADGLSSTAVTAFVPGGMTFDSGGAGPCDASFPAPGGGTLSLGAYAFTGSFALTEHQAPSDASPFARSSGYQLAGTGPVPAGANEGVQLGFLVRDAVCFPVLRDRLGPEPFEAETGTSGLAVDASSGSLELALEVRDAAHPGALVVPLLSFGLVTPPGPRGFAIGRTGARLLLAPGPILGESRRAWAATGPLEARDTDGDGVPDQATVRSPFLRIPAGLHGLDLHLQALVVTGARPLRAHGTSVFRLQLL